MGKQNRKQAPAKKPISSHPLFPAIVAMWFGALFGLGSLAVRASLLESIVIAGHIDTLVPSAAPPLGITARIMLALAMAMIGGTLGALIGRRIARPKPVAHERRRRAAPAAGSTERRANFGLSEPVPAAPYAQANEAELEAPVVTGRRRALAIAEETFPAYVHDSAPLPGGPPQILDVTEFDLADVDSEDFDSEDAEIVRNAPEIALFEVQPLDLRAFDSPGESRFEQPQAEAAPVVAGHSGQAPPQDMTAPPQALPRFTAPDSLPESFGAPPETAPAAIEAEADASEPQAPEARNGFAAATADPARLDTPIGGTASTGILDFLRGADATPRGEGPAAIVDRLAEAETFDPAAKTLPEGQAAQRLVTAVLAELSPVELIERLALTLRNRTIVTTRSGQLAGTAATALATANEPDSAFPATAFLAAVETAMPKLSAEPDDAIPVQVESQGPSGQDEIAAPPSPLQLAMPAPLRPIDFREYEEADDSPAHVPPRSFTLPPEAATEASTQAEIPAGDDRDAESGDGGVAGAEMETPDASEPEASEDVFEDAYSSLLDLSLPVASRQQFVRVEEPEAGLGEIEPVVIFPGQAGPTGGRFSAPAEMPAAAHPVAPQPVVESDAPADGAAIRRFDAPGNAPATGAAQPAAAAPSQDAAETEQALRSALASLQRMSGAA